MDISEYSNKKIADIPDKFIEKYDLLAYNHNG